MQYNPQNISKSTDIFQVYLDVFSDMWKELSDKDRTRCLKELYEWIKNLSRPENYRIKKVAMRSAINLLSSHINEFREFVYRDHIFWYDLLKNLCEDKNLQCSDCGQRALKNFYRLMGNILKHQNAENDKKVFLVSTIFFAYFF